MGRAWCVDAVGGRATHDSGRVNGHAVLIHQLLHGVQVTLTRCLSQIRASHALSRSCCRHGLRGLLYKALSGRGGAGCQAGQSCGAGFHRRCWESALPVQPTHLGSHGGVMRTQGKLCGVEIADKGVSLDYGVFSRSQRLQKPARGRPAPRAGGVMKVAATASLSLARTSLNLTENCCRSNKVARRWESRVV